MNPIIREGYTCEKYNVPKIESPLPDPQIILPEKEEEIGKIEIINNDLNKILINKSELFKIVNKNILIPRSYNKENLEFEDGVVDEMNDWFKKSQKNLEDELKRFYDDLN